MQSFKFINTLSQKKEEFHPYVKQKVNIYSCGPTVYDVAHIGNFRSYIFADILVRSLKLGGYQVNHCMNITDVDDKTINAVLKENPSASLDDLKNYTQPFSELFLEDLKNLNILPAKNYPKATENIDIMAKMVEYLMKKKIAYEKDGSIYFSIQKFNSYGNLSKIDPSQFKTGLRYNTDEYSKEDIRDFALWKNSPKNKEEGWDNIAWKTIIGKGRPGWHLECSAMIHNIFNDIVDIHTGGVDLIFPHHENEIAQSKSAFDCDFVKYWMHCEHLLVDGKKMSKSAGNFYSLRDILAKGYHPISIRHLLLSVHYRQKLNFTLENLERSGQSVRKIWISYNRLIDSSIRGSSAKNLEHQIDEKCNSIENDFILSLKDDLNISKALSFFHHFLHYANEILDQSEDSLSKAEKQRLEDSFEYFDSVLGLLTYSRYISAREDIPSEIMHLVAERDKARKEKDYQKADELRKEIYRSGYEVIDGKEKSSIRKISLQK